MKYFCKQSPFKAQFGKRKILLYYTVYINFLYILSLLNHNGHSGVFIKGQVGLGFNNQGKIIGLERAARLFLMKYAYNFTRYLFQQFLRYKEA